LSCPGAHGFYTTTSGHYAMCHQLQTCSDMRCKLQTGSTALYLNFGLDVIDGITAFHLESDGLACQRLHKYLHCFKCCLPAGLALGSQMILAWLPETLMGLCICPKPANQADLPRLRLQMPVPNQAYRRWYCFRKLQQ
jgi:hypothetical protein